MNGPATVQFGPLTIGAEPRVVGTVSTAEQLDALINFSEGLPDIVEIRLDQVGWRNEKWIEAGHAVEAKGVPVIVTLRMQEEGGAWDEPEADRLRLIYQAIGHFSAVDIELRSSLYDKVIDTALEQGRGVIVSCHDFERTPSRIELEEVMKQMKRKDLIVAKITTRINEPEDADRLEALLAHRTELPVCVMGMGELGAATRFDFPKKGSCLTYGFLDQSVAPGQVSCRELLKKLY